MIFEIMSPYDVPEHFGKRGSVIVDIRELEAYEMAHIPTSKHYSMLGANETLEDNIEAFDVFEDIIIYCHHGTSSIKVGLDLCMKLNKRERKVEGTVYSLYGGIDNYSGMKLEKKDFRENVLTK